MITELARRQGLSKAESTRTMRNWLIVYIDEFELRGADRAKYGENLLLELAGRFTGLKISNCTEGGFIGTFGFTGFILRLWGRCPHNCRSPQRP